MDIIETVINAMFIGIGSALGAYLANKTMITHVDKLIKKIERKEREVMK